jgi:hypothetical protein
MKKILLAVMLAFSVQASAQYYFNTYTTPGMNPGGLNNDAEYPVGGGLDPSWTVIQAPSANPVWSSAQTIPFPFDFNGSPVTQFKVSNSGVLTFDIAAATAPPFATSALPAANIPDNSVMAWGIQGTGTNDNIVWKTFGSAPNRQVWVFFTSYTFNTFYTYWSIVLEETTNKIYVVDQRSSGTLTNLAVGIQTNNATAFAVNSGNNNVSSIAATDPTPADNAYYEFIPGTRPNYDMSATTETVPAYLILNQAPFNIATSFINFGAMNVNSYDMNYSINNGPAVAGNIGSLNVATNGTTNGIHPTGWSPAATGTYNLKVWASNINGNPDDNMMNDTLSFTAIVVDTLVTRHACMEVFTSSTCGPCVAGNINMETNVIPNVQNYTVIKYQQDFPGSGDPYSTTQSVNRRLYYNINSIPRMEIDGQWDGNAASLTVPIFNSYQQLPAFMDITIGNVYYAGNNVVVAAQINPWINYVGNNFSYHIVVVEKQTVNNVGSNGETSFENVMMKMVPNENGTAVSSLQQANPININQTINMAGTNVEEMQDLRVVIFVQDNTTKEILQSAWSDVPVGINENNPESAIRAVFPNPANTQVSMTFNMDNAQTVNWTMTNIVGQQVTGASNVAANAGQNTININTADLAEGIYFLNLQVGDRMYTERVVITK